MRLGKEPNASRSLTLPAKVRRAGFFFFFFFFFFSASRGKLRGVKRSKRPRIAKIELENNGFLR